jgi:hypothetical protein
LNINTRSTGTSAFVDTKINSRLNFVATRSNFRNPQFGGTG